MKVIWITASPRIPPLAPVTTVRLAGGGRDKPYYRDGQHYRAGVAAAPRFTASLAFGENGWTGGAVPTTGHIVFKPAQKALLDELAALYWLDAPITVETGPEDGPWTTLLTGTVASASVADHGLVLEIADLSASLNKPLITARFAGTGGAEGGAEAEGRVKRRSWGRVFNIEGRILDKANNIYEFGDPAFPWQQWEALRDKGREGPFTGIAWQGSVEATLTALKVSEPAQGGGVVAPSIACAKWWTQPAGPLTADIFGELGSGYVETAPEIAARIVAAANGPTVVNAAAMAALRAGAAGLHIGDAEETAAQAIDRLLAGVSLLWVLEPAGTIRLREWSFSNPSETLVSRSVSRQRVFAPIKQRRVGYQKSHRLHNDGEIAAVLQALDVSYSDGTPIEDLKPAEPGATNSADPNSPLGPGGTVGDALGEVASQGQTLDQVLIDVSDLQATYGDTASASQSAQLAAAEADRAAQAATDADASEGLAAGYASTASTHKDAAAGSASAAQASAVAATTTATNLLPSTFEQDGLFWTDNATANPPPDVTAQWIFLDTDLGRVARATSATRLLPKGYFQMVGGRRYRLTAFFRIATANTAGTAGQQIEISALYYDSTKIYLGRVTDRAAFAAGTQLQTFSTEVNGSDLRALGGIYLRPQVAPLDGAGASNFNGSLHVIGLRLDDITESNVASGYASAAASSASAASVSEGAAGLSASAANQSKLDAQAANSSAQGAASAASSSAAAASGSAASAQQSATLAASIGGAAVTPNPNFSAWSGGNGTIPDAWSSWNNGTSSEKVPGVPSGNAYRGNATGGIAQGIYIDAAENSAGLGWYVVEADVRLYSGDLTTSRVLTRVYNSGFSANQDFDLWLALDKDTSGVAPGNGVVGRVYRYRKLIEVTLATAYRFRLYAITNNGGAAKALDWYRVAVRPASQAEIAAQTAIPALEASVSTNSGAITTLQGRALAYLQQTVNAGAGATAFVELRAETSPGNVTSSVAIGAREIHAWNPAGAGLWKKALSVVGGNVTVYGDLTVGGSILVGNFRARIGIEPITMSVYDGQVINYGANLGSVPEITPDFSGFPALAAGEAYVFRMDSHTPSGGIARVKKTGTGTVATQTSAAGTAGSGGPTLVTHKPTVADAYNGRYTFRVTGNMRREEQVLAEPPMTVYYGHIEFQTWFKPASTGVWTKGPVFTIFASDSPGPTATIAYNRAATVEFGTAIGQHASQEFGISIKSSAYPAYDTLGGLTNVQYATTSATETTATPGNSPLLPIVIRPKNA